MTRPASACAVLVLALTLSGTACSSGGDTSTAASASTDTSSTADVGTSEAVAGGADPGEPITFTAEIWVDNWFALSIDGEPVGEDSVPITTERSFNADTITFTATYPFTVGLVAKDYKESDSGLEYIGTDRQQMGDGGIIAQITDTATGEVVATTDDGWRGLVIHRAPTNPECETSTDPATECRSAILDEPDGWADPAFDDSGWTTASIFTAAEVGTKDGYDTIDWAPAAQLIWSSDLQIDNTILWRTVVEAP